MRERLKEGRRGWTGERYQRREGGLTGVMEGNKIESSGEKNGRTSTRPPSHKSRITACIPNALGLEQQLSKRWSNLNVWKSKHNDDA